MSKLLFCSSRIPSHFLKRGMLPLRPRPTPALLPHIPHKCCRCEVVERRAQHELSRAQQRLHLVDGFLAAMHDMDAVVAAIRQAPDGHAASAALQASAGWGLVQCSSCAATPASCARIGSALESAFCSAALAVWLLQRVKSCCGPTLIGRATACLPVPVLPVQGEPFGLSREQAEGVLGMTLRRLTSLEEGKLKEEQEQLRAK